MTTGQNQDITGSTILKPTLNNGGIESGVRRFYTKIMSAKEETILAVYIEFPPKIDKITGQIKKLLAKKYGSHYHARPHLTIYLCRFDPRRYPKLLGLLDSYVASQKPLEVKLSKLKIVSDPHRDGEAYIFLPVLKSARLARLHAQILKTANPLRGGLIHERDRQRLLGNKISVLERSYIERYGYRNVLKLFRPHISLGGIDPKHIPALKKSLEQRLAQIADHTVTINNILVGMWRGDPNASDHQHKLAITPLFFKG